MSRPVIAVIDSDPAFLELLHDVLADHGYHTPLHRTAREAFEMVLQERPDLVLVDL